MDTDIKAGDLSQYRVLIVDDDKMSRVLLSHQLASLGVPCEQVSNGVDALAILDHVQFDCILCDYRMPGMDGPALARAIRTREAETGFAGEAGKTVYIVAVSANADLDQAQDCFDAGMNDVLAKPIEAAALRAILERHPAASAKDVAPDDVSTVFEPSRLVRIYGRTPRLRATLEQWIAAAESALRNIRRGVDMQDCEAVADHAHRLLGSAGIAGAHKLAKAAAALENAVRGNSPEIAREVAEIGAEAMHAIGAARAYIEEL
ncbi:MAG: response regulator [Rhodobacteraceae bacterium]|nr:response regulator [Paracoccaceae bacterium]